ncbi:beta-hexosaminidase subunit beta-like [Mercenaria mercenaria]|uniref:beta-hexosaminidase subunit beta-like n=1 Tax=Mercenaria mercenaria TaxID=6596 RepID=UPI00234F11FF|nr:beta-hexosaminidase subunit beta-like [Mercenaria mercenaria]XP_045194094.2 beta-hexosaminidase subunit beta-like [Mercenaria mercenaria]
MDVSVIHLLAIMFSGLSVWVNAETVLGGAKIISLGKTYNAKVPDNTFQNQFLDTHSQPVANLKQHGDKYTFDLTIDRRYAFKPPIRKAPFSSVGEPWPLPKHYRSERGAALNLKKSTFKISVLNKSCDILTEAIKRYKAIIENHIIEEQYDFTYNFNEKIFNDHKKLEETKYSHVTKMADLEIYVAEEDCGYPHIDMKESYKLIVRPHITRLTAGQVWGALRGLETFSQLLFRKRDTEEVYSRVTEIEDEPRFPHRGILIDTARHFIYKNTIRDVLDGMAYNKMNVLHWHIVDDNSFPYKSEVFPKLSEKGAYHSTLVYTINDIKEIVEYARYRGIRVIPEFDTPGHTFSWLGYPEIKSTCYVGNVPIQGPMGPINPAQNETYSFLAKLFSEIYNVFPDNFVHLGGDELHSTCWATNPQIVAFLQTNGGIPAYEARSNAANYINKAIGYYFKRLISTLKTTASEKQQRKSFIMWEDVLKNTGDVPADSILQVWLGRQQNVRALNQRGYRALYSSCWYLDSYKKHVLWPEYYKCDPSPYITEQEEKGKVLGGEACVWTEYITTDTLMSFMWPRASAPAERLWSPKTTTDIVSAQRRLQEQRCRMIYRGLPTGHISGPDYCLRPSGKEDGPLVGSLQETRDTVRGAVKSAAEPSLIADDTLERKQLSLVVLSHYHNYMPLINIMLTLIGVYLILIASKLWKKKFRKNNVCPKLVSLK